MLHLFVNASDLGLMIKPLADAVDNPRLLVHEKDIGSPADCLEEAVRHSLLPPDTAPSPPFPLLLVPKPSLFIAR